MFSKLVGFIPQELQNKRFLGIAIVLAILAVLPLVVIVSQQQQEIRQRASEPIPYVPLATQSAVFGKAALLDGKSFIKISTGNINPKSGFTVEAWIKPSTSTSGGGIISKTYRGNFYKRLFSLSIGHYKDQKDSRYDYDSYSFGVTQKDKADNCQELTPDPFKVYQQNEAQKTSWQHIAGVIDSDGYLYLFVNGKGGKIPYVTPNNGFCESDDSVEVGATTSHDPENLYIPFDGQLDEVRISDIARYDTENFTPFTSPFISDSNTLALYHFDGDANDASVNGNNGQVIGNVQFVDSTVVPPSPTPTLTPTPTSSPSYATPIYATPPRSGGPTSTPTPPTPIPVSRNYQRVFVTSTTYNGNLGGLTGADAKCQERANAVNLGGTWKAWLSDDTISAGFRLLHNQSPYKLLNQAIIADNWTDLTDGTLQNPIKVTELQTTVSNSTWTNTLANGDIRDTTNHCSNWAGVSGLGGIGSTRYKGSLWTVSRFTSCDTPLPIFCFEQIPPNPTPTPVGFCTACSADVNKDGKTNTSDLTTIQRCLNKSIVGECADTDINKDGKIDIVDMNCVARNIGKQCVKP